MPPKRSASLGRAGFVVAQFLDDAVNDLGVLRAAADSDQLKIPNFQSFDQRQS